MRIKLSDLSWAKWNHKSLLGALVVLFLVLYIPNICESGEGEVYPKTPEGVVISFCRVEFEGVVDDWTGEIKDRYKYTTWEGLSGYDCIDVVKKYKISEIYRSKEVYKFKVDYEYIGALCGYSFVHEGKTETVEIIYTVAMDEGLWKILPPEQSPHVSLKSVVTRVKKGLSNGKLESENIIEAKKTLKILGEIIDQRTTCDSIKE